MDFGSDHDWCEQPALGGAPTLTLALHCALRKGLPHDGSVPLPQNPALPVPQTLGISRPAGEGSGRPEPPAGPEEEEGTETRQSSELKSKPQR